MCVLWLCVSQIGTDLFHKPQLVLKTGTSQTKLSRKKLQPLISLCLFLLNLVFHQLFAYTIHYLVLAWPTLQSRFILTLSLFLSVYSSPLFSTSLSCPPLRLSVISLLISLVVHVSLLIGISQPILQSTSSHFTRCSLRHPRLPPIGSVLKAQATVKCQMASATPKQKGVK